MATLYEYYNTNDGSAILARTNIRWLGQTFTTASAHPVSAVKLLLYQANTPGTVTVSIRLCGVDHLPTGGDLTSGTTDGDTLTTDTAGEWRTISLTSYNLLTTKEYAIIIRCLGLPATPGTDYIAWRVDSGGGSVGQGRVWSNDSGSTWTDEDYDDAMMFEVWDIPTFIPKIFFF